MSQTKQTYAQLHERFLARLIDGLLTLPFLGLVNNFLGSNTAAASLAGFLLGLAYYGYFTTSKWQASIGKRIVGIYVTDKHGQKLSTQNAFARELAVMVPSYPIYVSFFSPEVASSLFLGLSIVWFGRIAATENRVGVHDMLCHTRVCRGRVGSV